MPASMDFGLFNEKLWLPVAFTPERLAMHDEHYMTVLARLNPGVTRARADEEMTTLGRWLEATYPKDNKERTVRVSQLMEELVGDYRPRLYVLLGAVAFVLLIACANIANLLLARGAARAREISIRAAIGAGRRHLLAHALAESLVLAVAGGLLGLLVGYWGVALLAAYGPEDVPRLAQARVDGPVLAFAVGLTVLSGLVFGLVPALRTAARPPHEALKEGGRTGSRAGQPRPAAERAGRRRDRAGAGAADRRGPPDPELRRAQQRGPGLRSAGRRGGAGLAPRDRRTRRRTR